jgi:hypothetical protein
MVRIFTGYCSRHGHLYILVNSDVIKAKINSAMRHLFIIYFYLENPDHVTIININYTLLSIDYIAMSLQYQTCDIKNRTRY